MKKAYFFFGALLVILILAFSFSRSYLSNLEETAKGPKNSGVEKASLDTLRREMNTKINELEAVVDLRLDSLEQKYRESEPRLDTVTAPVTPTAGTQTKAIVDEKKPPSEPAQKVAANTTNAEKPKVADGTRKANQPTEQEATIYQQYLKRRWALPGDLSAYELKVAKNEILTDLGKAYQLSAEQISDIVDKVYESRRKRDKH